MNGHEMSNWYSIKLYGRCVDTDIFFERSIRRPLVNKKGRFDLHSPEIAAVLSSGSKSFRESRRQSLHKGHRNSKVEGNNAVGSVEN
jgi:hypothetical protein